MARARLSEEEKKLLQIRYSLHLLKLSQKPKKERPRLTETERILIELCQNPNFREWLSQKIDQMAQEFCS